MPILYNKDENVFNIQTPNTSYVIGVLREKYLLHLYYGKKIKEYKNLQKRLTETVSIIILVRILP